MKKTKVLQLVLLVAALALFFTGCSNPNSDDDDDDPQKGGGGNLSDYVYQISWDQQLTHEDFAEGFASLVDTSGAVVFEFEGAMQLKAAKDASQLNTTDNYFGTTPNSYQLVTDGSLWGGIFARHRTEQFDISSNNGFKIAIKGNITAAYLGFKVEQGPIIGDDPAALSEVNILDYTPVTDGDWTVYTMPFGEFPGVDFAKWATVGVWNPHSNPGGDKAGDGGYVAEDIIVDIAIY